MISPKSCKNRSGIVLVDILLAFSLSLLFVAIITDSSMNARNLFERAKDKASVLESYEAGMSSSTVKLFGDYGTEEEIEVSSSTSRLLFVRTIAHSLGDLGEAAGQPFCAVDYGSREIVGSYQYFQDLNSSQDPNSLIASSTPIILPLDPAWPLTDIEVRNNIAYISVDPVTASDPDLVIVDIRNANNPPLISSVNTGPGLLSVSLAGKRIYAAAASTAGQLHVIRFDGLNNPVLEKKFKLPLPYATATPTLGSSIAYDKGLVYLGTEKWDGQELSLIDVSDSTNPHKIGGYETDSKINDIRVKDGTAYVATSDQNQLWVLDVRDPAHPSRINSFGPSGWQRQEGRVTSLFEQGLSMGRTSGGFNFTTDHESFSWASTSSSTLVGPISLDIAGGVYGIVQDRYRIYLATRQANKELQVYDRNFTASTTLSYSLPIVPQAMTCDMDSLYILARAAAIVYKINFQKI